MAIPKINDDCLRKVKGVFDLHASTVYAKTEAVTAYLDTFSEVELWLFTFVYYVLIWNRRWKGVDFSAYYLLPCSKKQLSTFEDFLSLLAQYQLKTVNHTNERELVQFLLGCTSEIRDCYEIIMSRTRDSENLFMKKEIRSYLNLSDIRPEDVYGDSSFLNRDWKHLTYPLMVTTVPTANLAVGVIHQGQETFSIRMYEPKSHNGYTYKKTPIPAKWLHLDRPAIHTSTYLLVGMIDVEAGHFYPIDFFNDAREYSYAQKNSKKSTPYRQRLANLDKFLSVNYLRQIKRLPKEYCISSSEVATAVGRALVGSPHKTVLFCDNRNRRVFADTFELEGVISDYWLNEIGEAQGFKVWNNGREVLCSFDFTGDNHALLYNPKLVIAKYVKFFMFQYEEFEAGAATEILFDKPLYWSKKYTFRDGTEGYVECCPFCLRDDTEHVHNGICYNTLKNWYSMLGSRGADTWFTPTQKVLKRRAEKHWRPEFLNNIVAVFKGYRVVADEQGRIMFKTDAEAAKIYEWRVAGLTKAGKMPTIKYRTPEDLRAAYFKRFGLKGKKEEG